MHKNGIFIVKKNRIGNPVRFLNSFIKQYPLLYISVCV